MACCANDADVDVEVELFFDEISECREANVVDDGHCVVLLDEKDGAAAVVQKCRKICGLGCVTHDLA